MKNWFRLGLVICLVSLFLLPGIAQEAGKQVAIDTTLHYKYLLYLPSTYGVEGESYPLIFFLHGAGERGSNLSLVKTHGPPKIVNSARLIQNIFGEEEFPFIVVSPQCPSGEWWLNEYLIEVLTEAIQNYAIDTKRIYVTGISMGGFGTWSFGSAYPELVAAMAPICGTGDAMSWSNLRSYTQLNPPAAILENLVDIPVWAFHGQNDSVVPVKQDQKTVDALLALGGDVTFTIYPNTDHDSWTKTYNNLELYHWFLSKTKSGSGISAEDWPLFP